MANEDRPEYQSGVGAINGTQFHWGSGTPGKYWSIPYGDYPVTPNAPTGAWAHQVGAIPINNNIIPDPVLHRNRVGIMIHPSSSQSLDTLYTQGCFAVAPSEWPGVRQQILDEASKGPLYLHVQPGVPAAFTHTKTLDQAGAPPSSQSPPGGAVVASNASTAPISGGSNMNPHEQFIRQYAQSIGLNPDQAVSIARAEGLNAWNAKNPNAQSNVIGPGGVREPSFGDFQLHTGGGLGDVALKQGIDPRDPSQWQAADKFALDQMRSGGIGPWMTDPAAKAIAQAGGLTIGQPTQGAAPGPIDPSITARGGTSPAIPPTEYGTSIASGAPAAATTPTGPPTSVGDLFGRLTTPEKDAQGNEKPGTSPLDKAAKPFQQNKDAMAEAVRNAPNMMQAPPDTSAQIAPAAQQLMASTLATGSKPLTWSSSPYGSGMAGQQMGSPMGYPMAQGGIQQPQIPGLTLNSLGMGMGYYG